MKSKMYAPTSSDMDDETNPGPNVRQKNSMPIRPDTQTMMQGNNPVVINKLDNPDPNSPTVKVRDPKTGLTRMIPRNQLEKDSENPLQFGSTTQDMNESKKEKPMKKWHVTVHEGTKLIANKRVSATTFAEAQAKVRQSLIKEKGLKEWNTALHIQVKPLKESIDQNTQAFDLIASNINKLDPDSDEYAEALSALMITPHQGKVSDEEIIHSLKNAQDSTISWLEQEYGHTEESIHTDSTLQAFGMGSPGVPNFAMEDQELDESTPPGMEAWVKANKKKFKSEYGDKKGLEVLYATAWKMHDKKKNESVTEEENYEFHDGMKVKLTPQYADKDPDEIFTLSDWDGHKGRISDDQGRGWGVRGYQIVPVIDSEEGVEPSEGNEDDDTLRKALMNDWKFELADAEGNRALAMKSLATMYDVPEARVRRLLTQTNEAKKNETGCDHCEGTGKLTHAIGKYPAGSKCKSCNGTGKDKFKDVPEYDVDGVLENVKNARKIRMNIETMKGIKGGKTFECEADAKAWLATHGHKVKHVQMLDEGLSSHSDECTAWKKKMTAKGATSFDSTGKDTTIALKGKKEIGVFRHDGAGEVNEGWVKVQPNSQEKVKTDNAGMEVKTPDGLGKIIREYKRPTFSQMVPYRHEIYVELATGEKKTYHAELVKKVKQKPTELPVTEMAAAGSTGAGAIAQIPQPLFKKPKKRVEEDEGYKSFKVILDDGTDRKNLILSAKDEEEAERKALNHANTHWGKSGWKCRATNQIIKPVEEDAGKIKVTAISAFKKPQVYYVDTPEEAQELKAELKDQQYKVEIEESVKLDEWSNLVKVEQLYALKKRDPKAFAIKMQELGLNKDASHDDIESKLISKDKWKDALKENDSKINKGDNVKVVAKGLEHTGKKGKVVHSDANSATVDFGDRSHKFSHKDLKKHIEEEMAGGNYGIVNGKMRIRGSKEWKEEEEKAKLLKGKVKESVDTDLKRTLRDALVALKIQGVTEVPPQKIIDDFSAQGIEIGMPDLINLLQDDPMIQDVNKYKITFNTDEPNEKEATDKDAENSEKTVDSMARQALNKRMKD